MIDFSAAATTLLIWGLVVHLVCDWLFQNEWMSVNKMNRRLRTGRETDAQFRNRLRVELSKPGIVAVGSALDSIGDKWT